MEEKTEFRLLDLFCCGGGASEGYKKSGFSVTGVDISHQKNYKGEFICADAISILNKKDFISQFDVIHASPPCQEYSMASMQFRNAGKEYPDLISITRKLLIESGKPYIIENVPGSPLLNPITLCGAMFKMQTYRHRLFESNIKLLEPKHEKHTARNAKMGRKVKDGEFIQYVGHFSGVRIVREMTGLTNLNQYELAQSIPPQYTEYIGKQLIAILTPPP